MISMAKADQVRALIRCHAEGDEARAGELAHAVRHEIRVKLEEDLACYRSLHERVA